MKTIIFLFLFGLSLTVFDPEKSLEYAKNYCDQEYPIYSELDLDDGFSGMFVSRAIQYAGHSVMVCFEWKGEIFYIPKGHSLMHCLSKHGWKSTTTPPKKFKKGYPIFRKTDNAAMIFDSFKGNNVYAYGHLFDTGYCNQPLGEKNDFIYYYL